MSFFALSGLINAVTSFGLAFFVAFKGRRSKLVQAFIFFALSVGYWALFYFLWLSSKDFSRSLFYIRQTMIGAAFIPATFTFFATILVENNAKLINRTNFVISFLFLSLAYHPAYIRSVEPRLFFDYWPVPGPIFHFMLGYFLINIILAHVFLIKGIRKYTGAKKNQIKYVFVGTFIGFAGGCTNYFLWYQIPIPPYLNLFVSFYVATVAYAIVRHHLLDIEVIIKRTLVFAGLLAMVMAVVAVVSAVLNGFVGRWFAIPPNMIAIGSTLLAVVVFEPAKQFLIRVTDRFLFQKKSEIKDILNRLSESVVTIFDLDQIGHTILSTLGEALRLESGVIILRNKRAGNYRLLEHFGIVDDNLSGSIQGLMSDTTIGDYFAAHNRTILSLDHVDKQTAIPAAVSHWLQVTKARVCVPLFISEEQFGLMVLGKKKSDQEFSQDEIDFFPAIATQTSLALRNALLIETVVAEREEKVKAQHEAKRVHYAELLAHEVKNAVTAADLQARSLYEQVVPKFKLIQKKFFGEGLPPVAIKEYEKMCQKITDIGFGIQDRCKKIRVITKTAQHHLSSDLSIFEEIYIKMLWEDAITESCVKNVTFDFHGPADKDFYAFGNPVLLQRVFINLIKNADDAMTGQVDKRVALYCDFRDVDTQQVACFRFQDSGPGIQKENLEKIFQRGFSTKPKPKSGDIMASGLGYGLYSCMENIEEFHHGKMWAETPEGGGACFVFWIPMEHKAVV